MKQNSLTRMFVENVYLTTQVYKKIYILCIGNSQQNEQDGNQTWKNMNAIQTNDNRVVHLHVLDPQCTATLVFRDLHLVSFSTNTVSFHNIHK